MQSTGASPRPEEPVPRAEAEAAPAPLVSIVIPAWNKWDYTRRCLDSLQATRAEVPYEVIVVDNASTDETATALPLRPEVRVHRNERNLGFARACNQGAALARAPHVLFLNNDTEARPGWLRPMVRLLTSAPDIAMVGSKLLFPDGTLQHAGVAVAYARPMPISPYHVHYRLPPEASVQPLELNCVTAACMLVRADVFRRLEGFDEAYRNGYEDVDLCLKVREAGLRIAYTPESVLVHHESVSEGRFDRNRENEDLLNRRWMGRFTDFDLDRRRDRPPPPRPGSRPPVTAVVPVRDGLHCIAPCLEDLADQLGPGDQVVVADAGSTDCTRQFVAQFSAEHPGLVRLATSPAGDGLAGALRAGLAAAGGETLLVIHPQLRLAKSFIAAHAAALQKLGRQAVICSPVEGAGFCAAGAGAAVRTLAARDPGVLLQEAAPALQAAAAALPGIQVVLLSGKA